MNPNFCVSLPHQCSTTVSVETNPLVCENKVAIFWSLIKAGSDGIGSDRTEKTSIGSDQTRKTWIGSNSIKETHISSLKVGAFQILIKSGQAVSLDQDGEERSGFCG